MISRQISKSAIGNTGGDIRSQQPDLSRLRAIAGNNLTQKPIALARAASCPSQQKSSVERVKIAASRSQIPQNLTHFIAFVNSIF
ncbi:hypothetical protein QT971_01355 [Microcoleus sp. herbarium19]|uniref:hypothetical protein n=1 Tax=unclassified Microcoleus TaxID=2642155 RepID=UPI002FD53CEA